MTPQPHPHSEGSHQRSSPVGHATLSVPYAWQLPWPDKFFPLRSVLSHFHADSACVRPRHGPPQHGHPQGDLATTPTVPSSGTSPGGLGAP